MVEVLASAGFQVLGLENFEAARRQLLLNPPVVLITALKLGEYNGFHLVLRGKAVAPRMAAVVISDDGGPSLRREAQQAGATFVTQPVTPSDLLPAVLRTLFRTDPAVPIEPPYERRTTERRRHEVGHQPDRRAQDRRRDLGTLLQAVSSY
jgi:DNA-binding NtrC family response regulator